VGWWVHVKGKSLHLLETFAAIEKATISYLESSNTKLQIPTIPIMNGRHKQKVGHHQ
jgi:hypothetical protein